ncbi:MAG: hypothetical protein AAE977_00385 [Thermoplasmataceae archaeon]
MVNLLVEHRWKDKNKDEAFKVVGSIIEMQKNSKMPEGFKLLSVQVVGSENMAICNYEAPSKEALESLVKKVNPPTKYQVFEAQKIF